MVFSNIPIIVIIPNKAETQADIFNRGISVVMVHSQACWGLFQKNMSALGNQTQNQGNWEPGISNEKHMHDLKERSTLQALYVYKLV